MLSCLRQLSAAPLRRFASSSNRELSATPERKVSFCDCFVNVFESRTAWQDTFLVIAKLDRRDASIYSEVHSGGGLCLRENALQP